MTARTLDGSIASLQSTNFAFLGRLGWLDISKWPTNEHALKLQGVQALKTVFEHRQHWFPSMIWVAMKAEFDLMKVICKTALKLVDSRAFLNHIICNKNSISMFVRFAAVLYCVVAGDAVVEQAFPPLTRLLAS